MTALRNLDLGGQPEREPPNMLLGLGTKIGDRPSCAIPAPEVTVRFARTPAVALFLALIAGSTALASCAAQDPASIGGPSAAASADDGETACRAVDTAIKNPLEQALISDRYNAVTRSDAEVLATAAPWAQAYSKMSADLTQVAAQTSSSEVKAAILALAAESDLSRAALQDPTIDAAKVRAVISSAQWQAARKTLLDMCFGFAAR